MPTPRVVLAIGSDHAGVELKGAVSRHLESAGHQVIDKGPFDSTSVDYPDYAAAVAQPVRDGEATRGILICGTGIGVCIAANKVHGVRAALVHDPVTATLAAEHNDANVLCFGARLHAEAYALTLVDHWLSASFEPRHARRLGKISDIEAREAKGRSGRP